MGVKVGDEWGRIYVKLGLGIRVKWVLNTRNIRVMDGLCLSTWVGFDLLVSRR